MATMRNAAEQDIPRILELYRQLAFNSAEVADLTPEECRLFFAEITAMPGYHLLVAEEEGEIAATTVLAILPGLAHSRSSFALLEYVVVDEKLRRRGIGRALMEFTIELARQAGCYKIMLTSDLKRDGAHEFYRSLGFEASAHGFRLYF